MEKYNLDVAHGFEITYSEPATWQPGFYFAKFDGENVYLEFTEIDRDWLLK